MAKITLIDTIQNKEYEVPSDERVILVGRSRSNGVTIPQCPASMNVSGTHCAIYPDFDKIGKAPYVMDCDSTYGTYVRGKQIKGDICANLGDGDELRLGDNYKLKVRIE